MATASQGLQLLGLTLLAVAALRDIMARTVPNQLAAALAAAGLVLQALQGTLLAGTGAAVLVFVLAALCWRRGWMGGADVKLLGAAALLVPPAAVPILVATISLFGAALAFVYLLARRRVTVPRLVPAGFAGRVIRAERWRLRRGGPLPYAVAIASGAAFVVATGGMN